jgi:hypothetical protein
MSPTLHQLAALLQCVTVSTGLFGFVTNDVRQRSLGDFARKVGDVACPFRKLRMIAFFGAFRTGRDVRLGSGMHAKADTRRPL